MEEPARVVTTPALMEDVVETVSLSLLLLHPISCKTADALAANKARLFNSNVLCCGEFAPTCSLVGVSKLWVAGNTKWSVMLGFKNKDLLKKYILKMNKVIKFRLVLLYKTVVNIEYEKIH